MRVTACSRRHVLATIAAAAIHRPRPALADEPRWRGELSMPLRATNYPDRLGALNALRRGPRLPAQSVEFYADTAEGFAAPPLSPPTGGGWRTLPGQGRILLRMSAPERERSAGDFTAILVAGGTIVPTQVLQTIPVTLNSMGIAELVFPAGRLAPGYYWISLAGPSRSIAETEFDVGFPSGAKRPIRLRDMALIGGRQQPRWIETAKVGEQLTIVTALSGFANPGHPPPSWRLVLQENGGERGVDTITGVSYGIDDSVQVLPLTGLIDLAPGRYRLALSLERELLGALAFDVVP